MKQILRKIEGINKIVDFLKKHDGYTLICHISPDGDTLGSALALYNTLKLYNKRVQVICQDRVPQNLMFLSGAQDVICPDKAQREENVIAVDCADIGRLGKAYGLFENAKNTISIDHHETNTMYAMCNEVHPRCAATAEIMYEVVSGITGGFSKEIANCLYAGLMTDTGCFAFSNVTADTFAVASELARMGADTSRINELIYKTISVSKTRLLGYALSTTELYAGGRVGLCIISQADLGRFKAHAEDTEGIIDHIRDIESVEVAIFIRECLDGEYKVSLRSKDFADVASFARNFGGGGHVRAAGFKIDMEIKKLTDMVLDAAKDAISQDEGY